MELLDKVKEIFDAHPFTAIDCGDYKNVYKLIENNPEMKDAYCHPSINDNLLCKKYKNYIPRGWYGFSIGTPIIPVWFEIIDKILELFEESDPNFEIHQIKIKFGRIEFYVYSDIIDDVYKISKHISSNLYDKALIY